MEYIAIIHEGDINKTNKLIDSGWNPSESDNHAIRYAAAFGRIDIVKLLLSDPRVDPSDVNNYAIKCALECGYIETVEALLSDPRVIDSMTNQIYNNYPILKSMSRKYKIEGLGL